MNLTVWVLSSSIDYEGNEIISVHETEEGALDAKLCKEIGESEHTIDTFFVQEYEVTH